MTQPYDWCAEARAKLAAMEDLIAQGRGDAVVLGGGCTEPGGGIVSTSRTAREMAALLRQQIGLNPSCPPTSPPPSGRPEGHVGGSYDWWWWNFGRRAGHPYTPPTAPADTVSRNGQPMPGFDVGTSDPPRPSECACRKVLGIGQITAPVATAVSPWAVALTTSIVSAATGWVIEEIVQSVRGRRKRR